MSVLVEPVHVSAGCNRVVGGLDWGQRRPRGVRQSSCSDPVRSPGKIDMV